ncbi:phytanoyl-CoA dioxygenase domain-containing protein 1 homolog [Paramacrobiotus metropolitanus]|uniref:phytanoyl-CoA dioxygenase domain-containing protein 1 homolog n=1 Tax=Paramacrobiotus metropolitanus TaxID=2943436 RepID=UPI002445BEBC|nr:phytanoyl-CoA dioxygenase domain-containing protein 1 homolog [Paramacrobiotus metropolitanus]
MAAKMNFAVYLQQFHENGYTVIPNFVGDADIDAMKATIARLVDQMDPHEYSQHVFRPAAKDGKHRDDYFMSSGDKICYFFEPDAVDEHGGLLREKRSALNKIGHALGWLEPAFKNVTFSQKMQALCRQLGLVDPRLVQSMYIFKNPEIGQEVLPHQDSTFLYTDPPSGLLGFWIPLDDATTDNGCLYFIPGSQHVPPTSRFVRNPDPQSTELTQLIGSQPDYAWDRFEAAPAPKGSLVLIHGNVVHRSKKNTSHSQRNVYTFHLVDYGKSAYSAQNWLQPTTECPFPNLYNERII